MNPSPDKAADAVAVVGAGLAGLIAARDLARAGVPVRVFDKGRGVAGRTSTRRADDGGSFDHGAQYFTVRDERFAEEVRRWVEAGVAAEWAGRLAAIACDAEGCRLDEPPGQKTRYVGTPGMNAVAKRLASEVVSAGGAVTPGVRVTPLKRSAGLWRLTSEAGEALGDFGRVLVTAPAPQAAELLTASPALANAAKTVTMSGCWAAMVSFPSRVSVLGDAGIDGAFVNHGGATGAEQASPLSWIARDSSKPGRSNETDRWVLHGSPQWSEANRDLQPAEAARLLWDAFGAMDGDSLEPSHLDAHLWRFALPTNPLPEACLVDRERGLYAAGDWCGGPRVEGAVLSGWAAARAIQDS